MKLRSGCPYWQLHGDEPGHYPVLERDHTCQVAIIGAGITGALVAYHLAEAGIDALVVDRRQPGCGSTMASTGLLQYELDTPLAELIRLVGKKKAMRAYQLCVGTFDQFEKLVNDLGDRCGWERSPSLYLASSAADGEQLREEYRCRREAGIQLEYLSEGELRRRFGFWRPGALLSRDGGVVDSYRLNQKLLQRAHEKGLKVFAQTHVVRYEPTSDGVMLISEHGPVVRCRRVVFATGYETPQFLDQNIVALKSTYAVATRPMSQSIRAEKTLVWETSRPYFYVRWAGEHVAMFGGEDEPFADPQKRDRLIASKAAVLQQRFEEMFGVKVELDCAWAGVFGETQDGLPYIGMHPQFPNGYFALGYGGNGITFSLIAAGIIRDALLGKKNPDAAIFGFDR